MNRAPSRGRRSEDGVSAEIMLEPTRISRLGRPYEKAASWLLDSFKINDGFGSSAWHSTVLHPVRGWSLPYPETTGYIIPTLYDLLAARPRSFAFAATCIDRSVRWLLSLQLPSGAFPGGHAAGHNAYYLTTSDYLLHRSHPPAPSVFNSGQVLRGLVRHYQETGDRAAYRAIKACVAYLLDSVADDGVWRMDAYAGSSSPSYFTYITSALLSASHLISADQGADAKCLLSLKRVLSRVSLDDNFIDGMGFGGKNRAYTHTIGYTIAGLLDSSQYLGSFGKECFKMAVGALDHIADSIKNGILPGSYEEGWKEDKSYTCVTGNIQIALCFLNAYSIIRVDKYLHCACSLFNGVTRHQSSSGCFPGSVPLTGDYMRFRSPNWAAKYYLDLFLAMEAACGIGRVDT